MNISKKVSQIAFVWKNKISKFILMRIINIDAPKDRAKLFNTKKIPTFVRSFLRPLEKKYYPNFKVYQDILS